MIESHARVRDGLLIALTFTAGVVDAVSFLGLGQIFTANMTGNTVFLALAVGQRDLLPAVRSGVALLGFSVGAIFVGRILGRATGAEPWSSRVTGVLCVELALVVAFNLGWVLASGSPANGPLYLLIGLISVAMGIQSASARHLSVPGIVTTTVLTSALIGLMSEFAALGIRGPSTTRWATTLVSLFSGAAIGGVLMVTSRVTPPFLITAILVGVCVIGFTRFRSGSPSSPAQLPEGSSGSEPASS
ncbi:MAG: YoaK family protein [Thermoplasmata archaeon]